MVKLPEYHTVHFYHDNDNACALTALVNGERYHVIADPKRLNHRSKAGKNISNRYRKLLANLKEAEADEGEAADGTAPLFVTKVENEESSSDDSKDSGVDVSPATDEDNDSHDDGPSGVLKRWMLSPLKDVFGKSPKADLYEGRSVQDWYHCPTHFYELHIEDGKLQAEEETSPPASFTKRTEVLIPSMPLPKYIRELKIPAIKASDVLVVRESSDPPPIHPALVRHEGNDYFLKVVDINQYQPMKREISVMKRIEAEGLQNEMKVPLLRGLVHFTTKGSNRSPHVMGFLMDVIENPTPLTHMLDSDVPEEKRSKWAEESARMVDLLHQHGIIWGDAKGDNLMVDANDDLWIIDFGGSYTEGWVDPELNETEEGDEMGVRRIVNGLTDPENNTIDPSDEAEDEQQDDGGGKDDAGEQGEDAADEGDHRTKNSGDTKARPNQGRSSDPMRDEKDNDDDEEMLDDADVEETAEIRRMRVKKVECCEDWENSYEESRSRDPLLKTEIMKLERFVDMKGKSCYGWGEAYGDEERSSTQSKKRSAAEQDRPAKQRKISENDTARGKDEKGYCYCDGPDSGRMLACDGKDCKQQWFHFECIGIEEAPDSKKWYCKECRS
ncbi:Chromatin modification-related protein [Fulvia fulva]|uniref:Chromatin modification-related protein n=1 Tax=Passalora fulva TaxID=5499 RepID=A0A9Q8L885_PASFU|nr:Chromatin modification-related protein [Fulvia fulva]KAK4634604.1 Chromatin modification-related protein [Fulvia fulva]KAK4637510.1 Chromatin modification-related protein [Fulvia fulva]UJO12519.1 Chromatin modification-related protein [Fulvia fulva]WPV10139.1 Chromatin modification-related protein [Fulvia fulva]WPV24078.1 Chromatin modification-related protein [Fulvia fulva]